MSSQAPDVSVVVIAHNERALAGGAVRSILDQATDVAFEVVLVDDGSTDGTAARVIESAEGDQRLRVVSLPGNVGRGAARSAGVAAATGRVVGFVDADIVLPPDWLSRCLAALPGHAAVSGRPVPDGDIAAVARISGARPRVVPGGMPITGSNVLFDRSAFDHVQFDPRDRVGEDFRLASRLLSAGQALQRVPGLTVRHHDARSYPQALRWRFENGVDASTHPRELGLMRLADAVWIAWLLALVIGIGGAVLATPAWLLVPPVATAVAALAHVWTRFHPRPFGSFVVAWLVDIPLMAAYLLGRTVAIPRLVQGRRVAP